MYAELAGDGKKQGIKSPCDNKLKTMENGLMGTYVAGFCGYQFGKLFTVATKKNQARLAWEEMSRFIQADPDLSELFTIKDYKSVIEAHTTNSTITALSQESGLMDGFRSIYCSCDELHQHKSNAVYKAIYNGQRSLDESLISMITTRGNELNSFGKEMDDYAVKILKGAAVAEDFFVDIYALDEKDDIWDPNNWVKANPFLCTTEAGRNTLAIDARTAQDMGGADLRDFLTKSLNMWVKNTDDTFIDIDKWNKCGSNRTLEDFRGRECYVGLDLSSGGDLTTLALEFPESDGRLYWYSHSWMPRGRLEEHIQTDIAPYDLWETKELITVTGGAMDYKNDFKSILRHLHDLQTEYDLRFKAIGLDPHNGDALLADLEEFGCPVVMVTQSARNLHDATSDVQLLVKSEKVEYHRENELLTWSMANACVVRNSFDEIKVDKRQRNRFKRIDPVDATIDAHYVFMKINEEPAIKVDEEVSHFMNLFGW